MREENNSKLFMHQDKSLSNDYILFSAMVEILISSALGEKDYGFKKLNSRYDQTRYCDLASVMNDEGLKNKNGASINQNTLKQMVHRIRNKTDLIEEMMPDWNMFKIN